jgi:carbon-monoxide dehydrogenase medium subunit
VQLNLDASGKVEQIGIGLTNLAHRALRAKRSEDVLRGNVPDDKMMAQASQFVQEDCQPGNDLRGPEEYKRNVARVLTLRALNKALERAKGM